MVIKQIQRGLFIFHADQIKKYINNNNLLGEELVVRMNDGVRYRGKISHIHKDLTLHMDNYIEMQPNSFSNKRVHGER